MANLLDTRPAILVLLAAGIVAACGPGDADPDAAVRELLAAAEVAAEARDTGFFRDVIAASYRDSRGNDREQVINLIRGYFLTHMNVEVVSRVEQIQLAGGDAAEAVLHVGLAGRRTGQSLLGGIGADLYRLELELVRADRDWQIIGATWDGAIGE
jgi:hypothetical protein